MKNKRCASVFNRALIAIFLLIFGGISLGSLVMPDRTFSETENRTLQSLPEFSLAKLMNGKWEDLAEDYVSDQTILRDTWVQGKTTVDAAAGQRLENEVFLCDDTLIRQLPEPTEKTESTLSKTIGYVKQFKENCSVPVTFALIPTAADIWKDKLPAGAPTADETSRIREIYEQVGIDTVDIESALAEHKDEGIYYRTDHHWTTLGAYYGAQALFEAFGLPELTESELEPQVISREFYGTNWSRTGTPWVKPDTIETLISDADVTVQVKKSRELEDAGLYDPEQLEHRDQYAYFMGGNEPLYVIRSSKAGVSEEKLLVIRDSYSDSLAPFLAARFSEVHLWDVRYSSESIQDYIEENHIDRVLILYQLSFFLDGDNMYRLAK